MNPHLQKTKDICGWFCLAGYYYALDHQKAKKLANSYSLPNPFKRIYHYHNKKSAGTSLNHSFHASSGAIPKMLYKKMFGFPYYAFEHKKMYVGWNKFLVENAAYYYAHSHIAAHQTHLPTNTFTITMLRDPVDRIISYYKMLLHYKNHNILHAGMKANAQYVQKDFAHFITHLPKDDLMHQLYKFSKTFDIDESFEGITNCSHFFTIDRFDKGIDGLNRKLKLSLKTRHLRKNTIDLKIPPKDISLLKIMIEPEIKLYKKLDKFLSKKSFR